MIDIYFTDFIRNLTGVIPFVKSRENPVRMFKTFRRVRLVRSSA